MNTGFAKAAFFEMLQRAPWVKRQKAVEMQSWPLVDSLLAQGYLNYLDYQLARRLLKNQTQATEKMALFICHLFLAAKDGHLCIRIDENRLLPSVESLWQSDGHCGLSAETIQRLTQSIQEGTAEFDLIKNADLPIHQDQNNYYLQRHWAFETHLIDHLRNHLKTPPSLELDQEAIRKNVIKMQQGGFLLPEQADAIIQSCLSPLTLITGGPGTGKTYTAGQLIKVIWNSLSVEKRGRCQMILAAPTGKAAANLQKSLGNAVSNVEGIPSLQAKTVHALLGLKVGNQSSKVSVHRLSADLVIIDESSMIDVKLMGSLFQDLKPGSRLILLGDQHQLPSVEAGSIFYDFIQLAKEKGKISCVELKTCLRAELHSILELAQTVNSGNAEQAISQMNHGAEGVSRLQFGGATHDVQKSLVHSVKESSLFHVKHEIDPLEILNRFNKVRLLSPLRKGPLGVDSLNQQIWQSISRTAYPHGWLAVPILITASDTRQDLFNGETGVLMRKLPLKGPSLEDYALFPSRSGTEVRRLSATLLPKYEYAYCLSVYKSQGSEFDRVILVLPEGSEVFGREMFYTAITRARRQIDICGSDTTIQKTIQQHGTRLSGLQQRL